MSNHEAGESKDQFGSGVQELCFNQTPCGSQATNSLITKFEFHIFFLQVLQSRVEEVIKDFNREMEASEERMERIRKTVMNSAKEVIAKLEEAEARRKEELGKKMNDLIGKLSSDLEVMFYCKSLA